VKDLYFFDIFASHVSISR